MRSLILVASYTSLLVLLIGVVCGFQPDPSVTLTKISFGSCNRHDSVHIL
jgi:hypothetical protein